MKDKVGLVWLRVRGGCGGWREGRERVEILVLLAFGSRGHEQEFGGSLPSAFFPERLDQTAQIESVIHS